MNKSYLLLALDKTETLPENLWKSFAKTEDNIIADDCCFHLHLPRSLAKSFLLFFKRMIHIKTIWPAWQLCNCRFTKQQQKKYRRSLPKIWPKSPNFLANQEFRTQFRQERDCRRIGWCSVLVVSLGWLSAMTENSCITETTMQESIKIEIGSFVWALHENQNYDSASKTSGEKREERHKNANL